jgi:hypothetical protein
VFRTDTNTLPTAAATLAGRRRNQLQQQHYAPSISIHSQQREVQQLLQQAKQAGVNLEDSLGPLRCRVCGKLRDNYKQLHAHMVQRHKQVWCAAVNGTQVCTHIAAGIFQGMDTCAEA